VARQHVAHALVLEEGFLLGADQAARRHGLLLRPLRLAVLHQGRARVPDAAAHGRQQQRRQPRRQSTARVH
jgi:peptide subunit release factor 1 (eRF1)